MLKIIIIVFLVLSFSNCFSQSLSALDSLELKIKSSPDDTNKVNLLIEAAKKTFSDFKKCIQYGYKALSLSQKIHFPSGEGNSFNIIGVCYYQTGNLDSSEYCYLQALGIAERNNFKKLKNKSTGNLGILYTNMSKFDKALEFLNKALKANEDVHDSFAIGRNYADIANIYAYTDKIDLSITYNYKALELFRKLGMKSGEANVLNSLGSNFDDRKKYAEAIYYFKQSAKIKEDIGDRKGLANTYLNLGKLYNNINKPDSALLVLEKSNVYNKEIENNEGLANCNNNIGLAYTLKGDELKASEYYFVAYNLAQNCGSMLIKEVAAKNLSSSFRNLGDYKNAYFFFKRYKEIGDSIKSVEIETRIAEIETQYQAEKKDREIEAQSHQIEVQSQRIRTQMLIAILSVLFVIILSALLYNRYRLKQRSLFEKEVNRQQRMQFQAVIEAEEKERKRIAQELHDGLGQLLSTAKMNVASLDDAVSSSDDEDKAVFNNSLGLIDEAVSEVRNISHNLMPGALIKLGLIPAINELVKKVNTAGQINIVFTCPDTFTKVNETSEIAIYRIVQEVLNNSIRHSEAKNITIDIIQHEKNFKINISDNGKGMDVSKISDSRGIGWKNIYSRVAMLNGEIEIKSEIGKGTKLFIDLNIQ